VSKQPPRKPPVLTLRGLSSPTMLVTLKGPIFVRPAKAGKGGRPTKDVTAATVKAEKKRRIAAGEDASNKALAKHFHVSPPTIGRRLKE
jgi:hypothetical protein